MDVNMKFFNRFAFGLAMVSAMAVLVTHEANAKNQTLSYETVIATWQSERKPLASIGEAEHLLSSSRTLHAKGSERERVAHFTSTMRDNFDALSPGQKERLIILEARLLQGAHKFEQAKQHLSQIKHFRSSSAHLLLADIDIQLGNAKKAKEHCEKLVGQTSFLIAFTCMVNADFSQSADAKLLNKLKAFESYAVSTRPAERQWYYENLADMALQLGNAEEALAHLNQTTFNQLPISAILTWADAHFALGNYDVITSRLEENVPNIATADDGLLLKWAKAEQAQGIESSAVQTQLAKNMEIRVWREDSSHAAQVATYFLDVVPDALLALKFAKLNWQHSQTPRDKTLLKRAHRAGDAQTGNQTDA